MSARRFVDAVVIGAGPAGAAFARRYALEGRSVLVVEREGPGRRPVCGGFLGPEIRQAVDEARLGGLFAGFPKNPIQKVVLSAPNRVFPVCDLPGGGFAIERGSFDEMLIDAARSAGASFAFQSSVLSAERFAGIWNLTIAAADGLRDISARHLVRATGRRTAPESASGSFFACKTIYRVPAADDAVHLHFVRRGHVGFNPIGRGRLAMCLHADGAYLRESGGDRDRMMILLAKQNKALAQLLAEAERIDDWRSCPAQPDGRRIFERDGVFHVGDAVTMIHPVIGGGIPVAIGSGAILARILAAEGERPRENIGEIYRREWERRFAVRAWAAAVLGRAERSSTAPFIFGLMAGVPEFVPALVGRSRT